MNDTFFNTIKKGGYDVGIRQAGQFWHYLIIIVEYKGNSNYCMNGMSDNNVRVTKVDGIM